jgi:hypothetical protein
VNVTTDEARRRARALLLSTDYFAELGLSKASADSRMVARIALELADQVDIERSARTAMQAARDNALELLTLRARDE